MITNLFLSSLILLSHLASPTTKKAPNVRGISASIGGGITYKFNNCNSVNFQCPASFSGCGPFMYDVELGDQDYSYYQCWGQGYGICYANHDNGASDNCHESCDGMQCMGETSCSCHISACYCQLNNQ